MLVICINFGLDRSGGKVFEMTRVPEAVFVFCKVLNCIFAIFAMFKIRK
jgi:hypothetical protein